jgi:hypothetical protein
MTMGPDSRPIASWAMRTSCEADSTRGQARGSNTANIIRLVASGPDAPP